MVAFFPTSSHQMWLTLLLCVPTPQTKLFLFLSDFPLFWCWWLILTLNFDDINDFCCIILANTIRILLNQILFLLGKMIWKQLLLIDEAFFCIRKIFNLLVKNMGKSSMLALHWWRRFCWQTVYSWQNQSSTSSPTNHQSNQLRCG